MELWDIAGGLLEYIDESHTYIFDGVILPSITQMLKFKFGNKYNGVDEKVLKRAAEKGTAVHQAIEDYEKRSIDDTNCIELRNYKFLKKQFDFKCLDNEVPIVLFYKDKPIAAGRVDLIIEDKGKVGIADIKRTSVFDKEYVAYQTNLYRLGYQQSYGVEVSFLRGIHLRDKIRKYIELPIKEEMMLEFIEKYLMEEDYE